ncbi:hypothetical protein OH809_07500 [Streptomyces sp. NBC_00873]|uniref:hypothetical protein n=1 Tax=Streptomyces sp. NBC_00873 TaxID=2975852 RepID=UPI00386C39A3|nr:hypothetical protein OH809_07500 [Streptomyces sp. NBC_00873]
MATRTVAVTAAVVGAAALAATGINYAMAADTPAAAPVVQQQTSAPAAALGEDGGKQQGEGNGGGNGGGRENGGGNGGGRENGGGNGGGRENGGGNGGGRENGGGNGGGRENGGGNGGGRENGGGYGGGGNGGGYGGGGDEGGYDRGRIFLNERSYSAHPDGCITVVSGLGSRTLNVRNDSRRTVEVFRGATCDNGSPVATVGPFSTSNGVTPRFVHGGVWVKNGVVGSFRVIEDRYRDKW